jgi:very-short-patch-repair endonuclease
MKSMYYFNLQAGSYRRANVAITRQTKTHDIVMGNTKSEWLATCNDLIQSSPHDDIKKSARLLSELFTMANQNTDIAYLREMLGANASNIDSPLTQQLYDELLKYFGDRIGNELEIFSEVGYKIRIPDEEARFRNEQNVGFRIDLGIYSIKYQKFVLGIEMDGAMYHSGFIKEFSDMQRQEILESKGWELYRIWSTNWRDNLRGEFKALVDVIEEKLAEPVDPELDAPIEIAAQLIRGYRAYKRKMAKQQEEENGSLSPSGDVIDEGVGVLKGMI